MSAPPTPFGLTPRDSQIVGTNTPQIVVHLDRGDGNTLRVRAKFEIATDAGFTTNLVTWTQPVSQNNNGGAHRVNVPASKALHQDTWYHRAYAVQESSALESSPTATQIFVVSHALVATPTSPNNVVLDYATTNATFSWTSRSTEPTARQTAYQVVIQTGNGVTGLLDTGKVTSSAKFHVNTGALAGHLDADLRWNVTLWDEDDVAGDASVWTHFVASDGPTVTITAPTGTDTNPTTTVTWSYSGARAQVGFYVGVVDTSYGLAVYASGLILGAATSFAIPAGVLRNLKNYSVRVVAVDAGGILRDDSQTFNTDWTPPSAPTFAVDVSSYATTGFAAVTFSGTPDADFFSWRVYRKYTADPDSTWTVISTELAVGVTAYADYSAPPNSALDYAVVQVKLVGGEFVESVKAPASVSTVGGADYYWLVDPNNDGIQMPLYSVTADTFSDEFEAEETLIIGRGRRVELGDEWGYRGSLTAGLRDIAGGPTARQQRLLIEQMKRDSDFVWLRNPFGDSWKVLASDISCDRVAGVGLMEYSVLSINYSEVF